MMEDAAKLLGIQSEDIPDTYMGMFSSDKAFIEAHEGLFGTEEDPQEIMENYLVVNNHYFRNMLWT